MHGKNLKILLPTLLLAINSTSFNFVFAVESRTKQQAIHQVKIELKRRIRELRQCSKEYSKDQNFELLTEMLFTTFLYLKDNFKDLHLSDRSLEILKNDLRIYDKIAQNDNNLPMLNILRSFQNYLPI